MLSCASYCSAVCSNCAPAAACVVESGTFFGGLWVLCGLAGPSRLPSEGRPSQNERRVRPHEGRCLGRRWRCVLMLGVAWKTCSRLYGSLVFTAGGRLDSVMMCLFGCFAELCILPWGRMWQLCTCRGLRRGVWYLCLMICGCCVGLPGPPGCHPRTVRAEMGGGSDHTRVGAWGGVGGAC